MKNNKKWEKNITEVFRQFKDLDINKVHLNQLARLHNQKEAVDNFNFSMVRKSKIRYLTIIIDFSKASLKQDIRPNRASVTKEIIFAFLNNFIDQNPLSKCSVIATMKERALVISDFDQPLFVQVQRIKQIDDFEGCPSYQNALKLAQEQIEFCVPNYAQKEILIINSSITNSDPGNIFETFDDLIKNEIEVSVISLSAAIHFLQALTKKTGGTFYLAKNKENFEEIASRLLVPQVSHTNIQQTQDCTHPSDKQIKICFPTVKFSNKKKPCHCHNKFVYQFLECPNCKANLCLNDFYVPSTASTISKQTEDNSQNFLSWSDQGILKNQQSSILALQNISCKFCNILFVSSSKLLRTKQENPRKFTRLDIYLLEKLGQNDDKEIKIVENLDEFMEILRLNTEVSSLPYLFQQSRKKEEYDDEEVKQQDQEILLSQFLQESGILNHQNQSLEEGEIEPQVPLINIKALPSFIKINQDLMIICSGCNQKMDLPFNFDLDFSGQVCSFIFEKIDALSKITICERGGEGCLRFYCLDCDIFIHTVVSPHCCPTCFD